MTISKQGNQQSLTWHKYSLVAKDNWIHLPRVVKTRIIVSRIVQLPVPEQFIQETSDSAVTSKPYSPHKNKGYIANSNFIYI